MAAPDTQLVSFSTNGEYLAFCGADGRLKIWETATGTLKQEYTPTSHLTAMCTCLSWAPRREQSPRKKKKLKSMAADGTKGASVVAMGTLTGSILLYDVGKGDLESKMSGVHSDAVNCVCWDLDHDRMFSCSNDGHIVQWKCAKGTVESKWKAEKGSVHCLAVFADGQTLLSAGRTIKWWDIEGQRVLKKFTGHTSAVFQLRILSFPNEPVEESYFVSAAAGDRLLSAWHLTRSERSALASFSLSDEPVGIDLLMPSNRDQKILLSAVTKSGVLHVFEHHLNGKCKKPLGPAVSLQLASDANQSIKPVSILACQLSNHSQPSLQIGYGSFVKITCEKLNYSSCEQHMCLIRNVAATPADGSLEKRATKTPGVSAAACVMNSAFMLPSQPSQSREKNVSKRKLDSRSGDAQVSMEDKLRVLRINLPSTSEDAPNSENLAHLLVQGLQSQDEKILDDVFRCADHAVVSKTIQRLSVENILPLLKVLHSRLHRKWGQSGSLLHWIRVILAVHTSYLTTCVDLEGVLGPIYQLLDVRVGLFSKLISLKARLDLIVSQLNSRGDSESNSAMPALLVYKDDSSDDTDSLVDDYMLSHSESETDMWGEHSDEDAVEFDEDLTSE